MVEGEVAAGPGRIPQPKVADVTGSPAVEVHMTMSLGGLTIGMAVGKVDDDGKGQAQILLSRGSNGHAGKLLGEAVNAAAATILRLMQEHVEQQGPKVELATSEDLRRLRGGG